jgi:integrase
MKASKEHRGPALAIVEKIREEHGGTFLFPGCKRDKPLSNMAMLALLDRMGRSDLTAHGFRSTFRDWAAERINYLSEVVEMALAHTIGSKVEAAYCRGDARKQARSRTRHADDDTTTIDLRSTLPRRIG